MTIALWVLLLSGVESNDKAVTELPLVIGEDIDQMSRLLAIDDRITLGRGLVGTGLLLGPFALITSHFAFGVEIDSFLASRNPNLPPYSSMIFDGINLCLMALPLRWLIVSEARREQLEPLVRRFSSDFKTATSESDLDKIETSLLSGRLAERYFVSRESEFQILLKLAKERRRKELRNEVSTITSASKTSCDGLLKNLAE